MSERLYTAREILEKERDELRGSLQQKMKESLKLEETLREQLLHKRKGRITDNGDLAGIFTKAFDLGEDVQLASK